MQFSSISTQIQQHREKNPYICSKQDLQLQYSSIEMFKVKRQKKNVLGKFVEIYCRCIFLSEKKWPLRQKTLLRIM